jgi:hypothetical protein
MLICTIRIHKSQVSFVVLPLLLFSIRYKFMLNISETFCKGSWISDLFLVHYFECDWQAMSWYKADCKMITGHQPKLNQK